MFICVLHVPQKLSAGALFGHGLAKRAVFLFQEALAPGIARNAERNEKKHSRKSAKPTLFVRSGA